MKTALLANPDYDAQKVLAEPEEDEVVTSEDGTIPDEFDDPEAIVDYSDVKWEVPDDPDADFDDLLAAQLAYANTTVQEEDAETPQGFVGLDPSREWV